MTFQFQPFAEKMKAESLPEGAIQAFENHFEKLINQETGLIHETEIEPVEDLVKVSSQTAGEHKKTGRRYLHKTVSIKLNGGLGTGMGMTGPKGLLEVKPGYSFLDIVIQQNRSMDPSIPVVFMNSFSTSRATSKALARYPWLQHRSVDVEFLQYKVPKVDAATLAPAQHPENPSLEWCPPGHGNVYAALYTSGMLKKLLDNGYEYAFVSNIDNLGAVVDPAILGYFIENRLNFMMEAAHRTPRDKKGGHLAKKRSGGYVLREIAQCPEKDLKSFQNIRKHRFFNTNNIWVYLPALQTILDRENGVMDLPMIRNSKTLDPRDPHSPEIYQLESAMGSAVSVFARAGAVCVPKHRFIPVKNTNDLLEVRSDRYVLTRRFHLVPNPENTSDRISIDLDSACYRWIDDFENRFPNGAPSLKKCTQLTVQGDFTFGKHVTVTDDAVMINTTKKRFAIDDNQILNQGNSMVTQVMHSNPQVRV
jgi:UTP--glucose-1-phosphate uridylyltransferase